MRPIPFAGGLLRRVVSIVVFRCVQLRLQVVNLLLCVGHFLLLCIYLALLVLQFRCSVLVRGVVGLAVIHFLVEHELALGDVEVSLEVLELFLGGGEICRDCAGFSGARSSFFALPSRRALTTHRSVGAACFRRGVIATLGRFSDNTNAARVGWYVVVVPDPSGLGLVFFLVAGAPRG